MCRGRGRGTHALGSVLFHDEIFDQLVVLSGVCEHSQVVAVSQRALYSYGLYSYGLSSYGLYSYGLYSYGCRTGALGRR